MWPSSHLPSDIQLIPESHPGFSPHLLWTWSVINKERKHYKRKVFSTNDVFSKICTLYPRMCSSHRAEVKALLLNPLIFKQCAPAMLTEITRFLCCSTFTQGSHYRKNAYRWNFRHYLNLDGIYYHNDMKRIFPNTKGKKRRIPTSCIFFRQSLPTLSPSMTFISICMNSISSTWSQRWVCKKYTKETVASLLETRQPLHKTVKENKTWLCHLKPVLYCFFRLQHLKQKSSCAVKLQRTKQNAVTDRWFNGITGI